MSVGQDLLNVPFGEMVLSLGNAIAGAQSALDLNSIRMAQVMSGSAWIDKDGSGNEVVREGTRVLFGGRSLSLLELGFTPTFYQFVDTIIEVKMSISMKRESESNSSNTSTTSRRDVSASWSWWSASASASTSASCSTVSASYASKHSYSAEGASLIRTKLVPIPPPPVFEERVRRMLDDNGDRVLELSPGIVQLKMGESQVITVRNSKGEVLSKDVTYTSSSPSVARVDGSGKVSAEAEGVTTIAVRSGVNQGETKVVVKGKLE